MDTLNTESMKIPQESASKKSVKYGLLYGLSQAIMFFANAVVFYAGIQFIENGIIKYADFEKIFKVVFAIAKKNLK